MEDTEGRMLDKPSDIRKELHKTYKKIFNQKDNYVQGDIEKFLGERGIKRLGSLDPQLKEKMEEEINMREFEAACQKLNKESATGHDGITAKLTLEIKNEIPDLIFKVVKGCLGGEIEAEEQLERLMVFIPKNQTTGEEKKNFKKFRPISLLNQINKIAAHIINTRLIRALNQAKIIPNNMHAYLAGRNSTNLVRKIKDDIEYINNNQETESGFFLVNADITGAFDHSSRKMIYNILKVLGFGDNFIGWIKNLFSKIKMNVCYDGKVEEAFKVSAGLGQGNPLSATLYILLPLILVTRIEEDTSIPSLQHQHKNIYTGEEFTIRRKKLGSYSDDAQLCTTTEEGVLEYYKIMTEYSRMSSQGINWGKTTISSFNGYTQAFKSQLLEVGFKEENIKERNEKGTVLGNTIDLQNKSERH